MTRGSINLELDEDGEWTAHCIEFPGCAWWAPSKEEAIRRAPDEVRAFRAWLRSHGEVDEVGAGGKAGKSGAISEFRVVEVGRGRWTADDYFADYTFQSDLQPASRSEVSRCLRWLDHSRKDLLALVRHLDEESLRIRTGPPGTVRTIGAMLEHIADVEWWYLHNLGLLEGARPPSNFGRNGLGYLATVREIVSERLEQASDEELKRVTASRVHEQNVTPAFFDLRTGLAGESLQKCVNYGFRLALVGDFSRYPSESLQALIRESNRGRVVRFVTTVEEALEALTTMCGLQEERHMITGLDHVELAMPENQEDRAREFYGKLLGLAEVEKPESLAARGGCWFERGRTVVHLGVQRDFVPATKVHAAFTVADLDCGPGAAARAIARRIGDGYILAIDRSAKAIRQARELAKEEIASGRMSVRQVAIEDFALEPGEAPFDIAFAVRVGALDGRHPELQERAHQRIARALTPDGKLFIDGRESAPGSGADSLSAASVAS